MIDELHAQDVALIRDARIQPSARLTVLTGETGAGKTALMGALKLLVGERADTSAVREGAAELMVEGRVFTSPDDNEGVVVRRRLTAAGRGRCEIDGAMASVHELAERVGTTVDLCGQHEHQRLLNTATHVELLDAFVGDAAAEALAAYRAALEAAAAAQAEVERVRELGRSSAERLQEAEFVLGRIDEVAPREGELAELEAQLPRIEHAEALLSAVETARELLGGEGGATEALASASAELERGARFDAELDAIAESLRSALIDVEDVATTLRDYRETIEFDPEALERAQARMAELRGLLRSYGPRMEDVLARRAEAEELIAAASDTGKRLWEAEAAAEAAEAALAQAAGALDELRRGAAGGLAAAITEQMHRLEMGSAEVEVAFEELPREAWGSAGPARVELMYRPAAGMSARPLRRIASGGEVSRVMLAAKVVLGARDHVDTLVFDEVDAGVGGAVAVALASVLADLARTHQVIVVTHLAQVAVVADKHYVVRKSAGSGRDEEPTPETRIDEVAGEERVREVARMLSGDASEAALAHAREMLAEA